MKKICIVELGQYEHMVPLVGGYLEAYATRDPLLKSSYKFEKYCATPRIDSTSLMRNLLNTQADIYAFSCYIWNIGVMMSLLRELVPGAFSTVHPWWPSSDASC